MKKFISILLAGALAAAALTGCSKTPGGAASGNTPLVLNEVAHSIFYAPQYAAIELGYFEDEGIDLTLVNGAGADKVMTALISGDAQIGFMGSEASIYVYQEGSQDYAVNFALSNNLPKYSISIVSEDGSCIISSLSSFEMCLSGMSSPESPLLNTYIYNIIPQDLVFYLYIPFLILTFSHFPSPPPVPLNKLY